MLRRLKVLDPFPERLDAVSDELSNADAGQLPGCSQLVEVSLGEGQMLCRLPCLEQERLRLPLAVLRTSEFQERSSMKRLHAGLLS
jgi:hypothetical protein